MLRGFRYAVSELGATQRSSRLLKKSGGEALVFIVVA